MSGIPHEQRISWYLTNNFTDVHYPLPMGRTYLDANFFFYQTGYLPHVMPGDTYIESSADGYFYFTDLSPEGVYFRNTLVYRSTFRMDDGDGFSTTMRFTFRRTNNWNNGRPHDVESHISNINETNNSRQAGHSSGTGYSRPSADNAAMISGRTHNMAHSNRVTPPIAHTNTLPQFRIVPEPSSQLPSLYCIFNASLDAFFEAYHYNFNDPSHHRKLQELRRCLISSIESIDQVLHLVATEHGPFEDVDISEDIIESELDEEDLQEHLLEDDISISDSMIYAKEEIITSEDDSNDNFKELINFLNN